MVEKIKLTMPAFERANILVIGDVMIDRYWQGSTNRMSPEAPVPVVTIDEKNDRLGGAANVALNLARLGCNISLMGIIGQDESGQSVKQLLNNAKVHYHLIESSVCPTVTKLRVMSRHQQLLRMDFETPFTLQDSERLTAAYVEALDGIAVVLISDYAKGSIQDCQALIRAAAQRSIPVFVDPKTGRYDKYRFANLLTPNLHEFEQVVGKCHNDEELVSKGAQLMEDLQLQSLLITRGEQGITLLRPGFDPVHLPAHAREVYDVTGAGDTVIAVLSGSLAAGKNIVDAISIANIAAAIVVGKLGTATVSPQELRIAIKQISGSNISVLGESDLLENVKEARRQGEKIVFTNGCFDILHAGHVNYLNDAKRLGDRLIVAVNSDASVKALKGEGRPVNSSAERMAVLSGLSAVDWVVEFSDATPERLLDLLKPDLLVKGGDYSIENVVGHERVTAYGGEIAVLGLTENCSTTAIINKISAH